MRFLLVLLTLSPILWACAQVPRGGPDRVPLQVLRSGQQIVGASSIAGGTWITDRDRFTELIDRIEQGTKLPAGSTALPEIDFSTHGVLLLWMGEMPTAGFSLELAADTAPIADRSVRVPVRWIEPGEGALTAQVITNPYLLVGLPEGSYDSIAAVDQEGVVRVRVEVEEK